mgnify:CR=1 FL=1
MPDNPIPQGLLPTSEPDLFFEDNAVGRLKKEVWDASDEEIDAILADYGIPSPVEWGKPGSYIQTTTRWQVEANRKKNDVVFIPVGCTELHGQHLPSAADTLYVSAICEGVRRFTRAARGLRRLRWAHLPTLRNHDRRIPDCGRLSPTVYYAHGYSGQGVALTGLYGKLMAEAIRGTAERFDLLAKVKHLPFPGGPMRTPMLVAAMMYYRIRDALS